MPAPAELGNVGQSLNEDLWNAFWCSSNSVYMFDSSVGFHVAFCVTTLICDGPRDEVTCNDASIRRTEQFEALGNEVTLGNAAAHYDC